MWSRGFSGLLELGNHSTHESTEIIFISPYEGFPGNQNMFRFESRLHQSKIRTLPITGHVRRPRLGVDR
jgi:hypothetical protein